MSSRFRHLLRTITINETRAIGGVTMELSSLELFLDGMKLMGRLTMDDTRANLLERQALAPFAIATMSFHASDDTGRQYLLRAGNASGSPYYMVFAASSSEPLDVEAKELRLELPEIRWLDPGRNQHDRITDVQAVHWTFTVKVTALP